MAAFILLLATLLHLADSRYYQTSIKFTLFGQNKGWVYIDKMTFSPGTAKVEV